MDTASGEQGAQPGVGVCKAGPVDRSARRSLLVLQGDRADDPPEGVRRWIGDAPRRADRGAGRRLCQMANLLFWMAMRLDLEIVERHRHESDLFPDDERTVPFGMGATVFYNYRDLQFRNNLRQPLLLRVSVQRPLLCGSILSSSPVPFEVEIAETWHRFVRRCLTGPYGGRIASRSAWSTSTGARAVNQKSRTTSAACSTMCRTSGSSARSALCRFHRSDRGAR